MKHLKYWGSKIGQRSLDLIKETPSLSELFTGGSEPTGGGVSIQQNNDFSGIADLSELQKVLDDNNNKLLSDIKSYAGG